MDMGISMNMNMIIVRETGKETTRMYNPNALNPFCQPYNVPCYHGLFPYNNGIGRLETTLKSSVEAYVQEYWKSMD